MRYVDQSPGPSRDEEVKGTRVSTHVSAAVTPLLSLVLTAIRAVVDLLAFLLEVQFLRLFLLLLLSLYLFCFDAHKLQVLWELLSCS